MLWQAEFTGLIALLLTELGPLKLFYFFEKSEFYVHHRDQALVVGACHEFQCFQLIDARQRQWLPCFVDLGNQVSDPGNVFFRLGLLG